MKSGRGRRSEPFWPSIVMRKWLNIKPKVHEFSEDEVDTESEDDDARATKVNPSFAVVGREVDLSSSLTSGRQRKGPPARHWRRKSETLRVQYISKKDIRVTIGTWNVAGRVPVEELELDELLCTQEPADMYILGFQEIVPLNAGNVLGAEDSRPIPKWEAIIRRTLNKSLRPKTVRKSYSAPPSPLSRELASRSGFVDNKDVSRSNTNKRVDQGDLDNLEANLRCDKINGIDSLNKLDWPEYSLDASQQALTSGTKLRRVLSSIPRTSFGWLEESQVCSSQDLALKVGLKRVYHSSGNLGMLWSEHQEASDALNSLSDISDISLEEDSFSANLMENYDNEEREDLSKPCSRYVRIVSKQMVGIYISIWICRRLRRHINNLKVSPVGVGLMGYMGNKGAVSVSMSLFQTRLCFVCSHLTSGHKDGDQQKRNTDVNEILQRTRFSSVLDAEQRLMIPSHDRIFWFGDLNYRLNMSDAEVREFVSTKKWGELMNYDQLSDELKSGHIFDGWNEGSVDFAPSYKYDINSNRYVGENAKEGEKIRSPAWCDRILWLGKGIRQLSYWRPELDLSDHRPVSSTFLVEVEVFNQHKLQRALNYTNPQLLPENL